MTVILPNSAYEFVGSAWSLFPPDSDRAGLNYVDGTRRITAGILAVCLIQQGEDPIHPSYGMAPDLFEPLSNYTPQLWVYHAEKIILQWVPGIEKLHVDVTKHNATENQLFAEIQFIPMTEPDLNTLTWNYYAYQGAAWEGEYDRFLQDVNLNGQPFFGLER